MTVPDIAITVAAKDAASRTFAVTVPPERVRLAEDDATSHFARQARLPGFRKGKVPRDVVRKRFADAIRQTALEDLIRETWQKAKEQENPDMDTLDEKEFRYPGPKPQTKEAGIVMLADAVAFIGVLSALLSLQLERARTYIREKFGQAPAGLWPSAGV